VLRIITLTYLLIGVISTCFSFESRVDTSAFISDIDTLRIWVEKYHPLPFARCSRDDWANAVENAKAKVKKEESEKSFTEAVGKMLSVLKDSHTSIALNNWRKDVLDGYSANSLQFTSINNLVYIKSDDLGHIKTGTKVDSIGVVSSEELLSSALLLSPQEGNSWTGKTRIAETLLIPVAIEHNKNRVEENFEGSILINGESYQFGSKKKGGVLKSSLSSKKPIEWIVGDDEVILKIKSFSKGSSRDFYRKLKRGFRKLENHSLKWGTKALVIDLRGNTGGYSARMSEVLYYITDQTIKVPAIYIRYVSSLEGQNLDTLRYDGIEMGERYLWDGPTTLLIDGLSSSASVSFAGIFRQLNRGPVLGEACMGARSGTFADPIKYELPESGLMVSISSGIFSLDEEINMGLRPVEPTRWVQWNVEDLRSGVDPIDGAIRDWILNPDIGVELRLIDRESKVLWKELETVYSRERGWGGETRKDVWERIVEGDSCLSELKNMRKNAELEEMKLINKDIKDCRTRRNTSIQIIFPIKMRKVFEELTSPNRPAVLHFGLHNRADCNVCKPSN
jgi:hypothetical protein